MQIRKDLALIDICHEAMQKKPVPGLTAAIIQDGQVTQSCALGVRDDQETPMTEETLFEAASTTKPLFAVSFLKQCDRGLVDLDVPVARQGAGGKSGKWSLDPRFAKVTPRLALTHATGFKNWDDRPAEMLFEPGHRFSYSGEGYYMLQHLLEEKLGKPWPQYMNEAFFEPLGFLPGQSAHAGQSTHAGQTAHANAAAQTAPEAVPEAASSQLVSGVLWTPEIGARMSLGFGKDGKVVKRRDEVDQKDRSPEPNAAWSLYANAKIYAQFLTHLMDPADRLGLSEQAFRDLTTTQRHAYFDIDWACGFGILQEDPSVLWHWGDNRGFESIVIWDRETRDGLTVFTNSDAGSACYTEIVRAFISRHAAESIHHFIEHAE
ncbi:MAG: beta-lactamase family protein [Firmicutes bacterium]|nr:beta-lactamase family protein [Bacillota bacterium]